jgi:DNA/RNA-binding domain of Phe-tRNA-synthetase-like protein
MSSRFSVSPDIFDAFPDYFVDWVAASFDPLDVDPDAVRTLMNGAAARIQTTLHGTDLKDIDAIAVWRSAFSRAGWSGSKFPPSVEALTKRISRGDTLPDIHPIVNLVNVASLTYLVPVGCHDLATTEHLEVRYGNAADEYLPMGDAATEHPENHEIVYASGNEIRTRRWVWRQSRTALVKPDASRVFIPIDGFVDVTESRVEAATAFINSTLVEVFHAKVQSGRVDRSIPTVELELA